MNSQSKGLKQESRAVRKKPQSRSLGKWSGEHQPHRSAPVRIGRHPPLSSRAGRSAIRDDAIAQPAADRFWMDAHHASSLGNG